MSLSSLGILHCARVAMYIVCTNKQNKYEARKYSKFTTVQVRRVTESFANATAEVFLDKNIFTVLLP